MLRIVSRRPIDGQCFVSRLPGVPWRLFSDGRVKSLRTALSCVCVCVVPHFDNRRTFRCASHRARLTDEQHVNTGRPHKQNHGVAEIRPKILQLELHEACKAWVLTCMAAPETVPRRV